MEKAGEKKIKKMAKKKENKEKIDITKYTHNGEKLTIKEKAFIDFYIETGNATQAYLRAGFGKAKHKDKAKYERYVKSTRPCADAFALIENPKVGREIHYLLEKRHNESVANAQEVMKYFTSVMRGELQDQFGLDAPLSERTKAAQELAKRTIDIENKVNGKDQAEVHITLDWAREEKEN